MGGTQNKGATTMQKIGFGPVQPRAGQPQQAAQPQREARRKHHNTLMKKQGRVGSHVASQQNYLLQQLRPQQNALMLLSPCTGTKRALLIGVNYIGENREYAGMSGCENDVSMVESWLCSNNYLPQHTHKLVNAMYPTWQTPAPTRSNIIQAMKWLTNGARPGDHLFFYFSGNGSQIADQSRDSCILPLDWAQAGVIGEDEMFDVLVRAVPIGVRLTCVMDCGFSESVLDLPYQFIATKKNMAPIFEGGKFRPKAVPNMTLVKPKAPGIPPQSSNFELVGDRKIVGDVICFSACRDDEDCVQLVPRTMSRPAVGAFTMVLIESAKMDSRAMCIKLLEDMRNMFVLMGVTQVPQLSASRPVDLSGIFNL